MRKLFTRKKEPYLRYHIDFLGSYTTRPSITNNMSHWVLRLLRYRYNLRKRTRMSSDLASFGYRRGFVSKYLYRTDINRPQLRLRRYKWWFVSRR